MGSTLLFGLPNEAAAQMTAFKTGEETYNGIKRCYYEAAGNRYVKTVSAYEVCPLSAKVKSSSGGSYYNPNSSSGMTAFKKGERVSGGVRHCYYEALGKQYVKSVASYALCPLSVTVQM
jgi:hypothetical protein